jgi:single-stranded-DNA-specific exonuclease
MSLLEASAKSPESLTLRDISFSIAPRINAAGRMESGLRAVELLRSNDRAEQDELAERINAFNQDRRETQAEIFEEAKEELDTENYPNSNVLYRPHWHKGVVGIVASKIVETHYRPTIILTKSGDHLGGSARSVIGFDVYNAIEACEAHILQFGGHKYAAGLTLDEAQLPHFKKAFEAYCAANLTAEMKTPELEYDAVASLDQFTERFYAVLSQMEPHGEANQAPRFLIQNLLDAGGTKAVGADESHLRVVLQHPGSAMIMTGIAFGQAAWAGHLEAGGAVDIIASLEINEFRGQRNLQLMVEDIRSAQGKS